MPTIRNGASENIQRRVAAFLSDPASHRGAPVSRIDTHAASVFLAGPLAYKIKKAVRFTFLDYSTLALRKAACERELEVNRRFAPDLYLKVSAITAESDGTLKIDGAGEPVEYAVVMNRFDENATLDRLAQAGPFDRSVMARLGMDVAAMHRALPPFDGHRWLEFFAGVIDDNRDVLGNYPGIFPPEQVSQLAGKSAAALAQLRPLLEQRGRAGFVRECHGDLHLGNIALIDGVPSPFDAIEFDPLIAAGDVLYDLAFLLMDLTHRGQAEAANVVFNRYLTGSKDDANLDALGALPLFLSVRAAIRAKVTAVKMAQSASPDRPPLASEARAYFDLALRLLSPARARLVAVGGLSGTGKSVLAQKLAPGMGSAPGAVVLRSDVERKIMFGVAETVRLPPSAYAESVSNAIYATLCAKARRILTAGHSVIVDAVFAKDTERTGILSAAADTGAPFDGLFLTADLQTRLSRVTHRINDASDADANVVRAQDAYLDRPTGWTVIDASGSPETTLRLAQVALDLARL